MKEYYFNKLSGTERKELVKRKSIDSSSVNKSVEKVCIDVKKNGLKSAIEYAKKFDGFSSRDIYVTKKEFTEAEKLISPELKSAIKSAYKNIYKFHQKQYPKNYVIETAVGVKCRRKFIPIENVGLYIPAGTAPLPSTMLMLGIPAKIAGCKRIVAASPAKNKIHPAILFAAKICGITEFIKIGGAQAISLFAYGSDKFRKVDKIFGPGNQYVTAAKGFVSVDPEGCAIDMLSGPSELIIIADSSANPNFIAADLLSQAEHGKDSVVGLLTISKNLYKKVEQAILKQINVLPRKNAATAALENSFCVTFENLDDAFKFCNSFAPEHLILNMKSAEKHMNKVINAGSVFIGEYTPESAGDYASGTNHSLPTYGFARASGGVSVEMFMKGVTFQSITNKGIKSLSKTIITLAEAESLQAHAEAVRVRLK
jgi:histidinol dehydrogenase